MRTSALRAREIFMANAFVKAVFIAAILVATGLSSRGASQAGASMSLAGEWKLRLDPQDEGIRAGWAGRPMVSEDRIRLPNTTDLAGMGFPLDTNSMQYPVSFPATTRFPGVAEPVRA